MFLKEFFEKVIFEKKVNSRQQKHEKLPTMQRINMLIYIGGTLL